MKIVITGTSRGIGLELCRLALQAKHDVCAVARRPEESAGLQKLKSEFPKTLTLVSADLASPQASETVLAALKGWAEVDLLINNAGVLDQKTTAESLMSAYQINAVAPFLMTQALLPMLKKSEAKKVVHITSVMGSITENTSGGYYGYRASKAALNMINKSLSVDQAWLTCLVLHPGWVKTDMGGSGAAIEVATSAQGLWKVLNEHGLSSSGKFFDFRGRNIPW